MLRKKIKIIGSLMVLAIIGSTIGCLFTSCSVHPDSKPDEFSEYINDRSFSIAVEVPNNTPGIHTFSLGTAWIFENATPTVSPSFQYYIATNLHVSIPFNTLYATNKPMYLGYNRDFHINKSLTLVSDYAIINNWELLGNSINSRPIIEDTWSTLGYECDVDFNVFKVNFGNNKQDVANLDPYCTNDTINDSLLLQRLEKLNNEACDGTTDTNGKIITPFADSSYKVGGQNLHVAGFPVRPANSSGKARWTYYSTKCASTHFSHTKTSPNLPLQDEDGNWLTQDDRRICIVAKEIGYQRNLTPYLTGGSSGSLVINDKKEAVAINYAGELNKKETDSIQSLALMLNCNDDYYGKDTSTRYEVWNHPGWFGN